MHAYKIVIDDQSKNLIIFKKNLIGSKIEETYHFDEIFFTYKRQNVSARGAKENVCVINSATKTVAVLTPGDEAWEDNVIKELSTDMISAGIKRLIDKYDNKEVVLN